MIEARTVQELLKEAPGALTKAGVTTPRLDALLLLGYVLDMDKAQVLANLEQKLTAQETAKFQNLLAKRCERIPLAYITGHQEFYGQSFTVNQAVLIPRPESEALVDMAIELAPKDGWLLDLGTGSGALAISIALNRPDLKITATDISKAALKVAKANALSLKAPIDFLVSDLLAEVEGQFDVIIANLPYVSDPSEVSLEVAFEPKKAVFSGTDGLGHYRQLFAEVAQYLKPTGYLITENDPDRAASMKKLAKANGLHYQSGAGFAQVFQVESIRK